MDLMSYQLEPAQMALNKTRQRILIADTVGLGKTLEAGILMSELIARGKGKRILVVTVKSMMTQFQKEMWNRFTIPLVRLDSSRIQSVRAKLPTNYNPFFYYDKTIISVDTLKNDLDYRTHLENAWWDIIVIDEAHNVAKRGDRSSQRSKLASLLANRSDTLIMLTATPHDGKGQSVASLMNMLDPTAIADEENYTKDDIEGLLIRRFKKDIQDQVSGAFKERVITIERCVASAREEAAYDIFADMKLQMDESRTRGKGILFKTSLEKSLFSSPAACIKSIDARLRKLEKKYPDGDMPDIATLKELKAALELISPADFSRYAKLLKLLNSTEYGWSPSKNNDRLVIFTERIETMKYLAENLKKDLGLKDNQLEVMHGGMSDKELQRIVDEFGRAESPIRVIVASDVASEGINLHYLSHRLIHFDIPWSLMVFQQRNGRVDRYGQTEQPDALKYALRESIEMKTNGAFTYYAFEQFINSGANYYHLSNERKKWLPGVNRGLNVPKFVAINHGSKKMKGFDGIESKSWYSKWINKYLPMFSLDSDATDIMKINSSVAVPIHSSLSLIKSTNRKRTSGIVSFASCSCVFRSTSSQRQSRKRSVYS